MSQTMSSHEFMSTRSTPSKSIARKALTVWRIRASIESLFVALIPIGYGIMMFYWPMPPWVLYILILAFVIFIVVHVIVAPYLRWKRFKYEVYDEEVELQYGVIIVRRTLIPMIRVQHVDTEQGPLLRKFDLAAVTISTAATTHRIPALTTSIADELRNQIVKLASVADDDDE
ncbi:PH domain-containing protein [Alkalihalobacterium elongatum]|uniref:PH domain-containing protein n=1 Tax=Alkalihalobacterium elongatum TaxID=2675466 RepID=UPI001F3124A5|nr:PH domain-containing protein [Alkalihalobacterium elongatum]